MNKKMNHQVSITRMPAVFSMKPAGILILSFLLLNAFVVLAQADDQVQVVLDRVRNAMGYENLKTFERGIELEGKGIAFGLECCFHSLILPDGRFRNEIDSELSITIGFDGKKGWLVDFSGMPGHLESVALETAKIRNWVLGGYWLDPACPLEITLDSQPEDGSLIRLGLMIPNGFIRAMLEIDAESALPSRLTWKTLTNLNHLEYKRFKVAGPDGATFLFPHLMRIQEEGQDSTIVVDKINEAPPSSIALCSPVTARPEDTRFDGEQPASVTLNRLPSGHLTVRPKVDGRDVGLFLFDTGAGMNVIDRNTADKLDMQAVGEYKAVGIGGVIDVQFRIGKSITLGPVEICKPYFVEIDLEPIGQLLGIQLGGLVGTDFLNRCLAELDITDEKLFLYPPGTWNSKHETWQEIIFYNNSPCLMGALSNGRKGLFMLDTGAGGATVALNESFIDKEELFGDNPVSRGASGGAGGMITTYSGRIPWFELCGRRMPELSVSLMESEDGVSELKASAGLIGNRILSKYRLLLDYPKKRVALQDRADR